MHPEELAGLSIQAAMAAAAGGLAPPTIPSVYAAFSATTAGLVPASGGGTVNFLRADGAWTNALTGGLVLGAVAGVALAITASGAAGQALTITGNNSSPTMTISEAGGNGVRISFVSSAAAGKTYQLGHNFVTGTGEFAVYDLTRAAMPFSITTNGGIVLAAPASGQTLTVAPSTAAGELIATSAALTTGAGVAGGTLLNAPSAGNPTKWIKINDNGTIRSVPAW